MPWPAIPWIQAGFGASATDMERAEARRLQPHYIESFFRRGVPAARRFGQESASIGVTKSRNVPAPIRNRDRLIGIGEPVLPRYERIAFEKARVAPQGQPLAALVCPGHPLMDALIDLTLERHRDLLKRGAVLVDERDPGTSPRLLFYLEHAIQDASVTRFGDRRVISRRMLYIEADEGGATRHVHYAPYLDYRPLAERDPALAVILDCPECAWLDRDMESKAQGYAVAEVVPQHLKDVRDARLALIARTETAVKDRLTKEIAYWDHRAEQLKLQEQAGKTGARLNSIEARKARGQPPGEAGEAPGGTDAGGADFALAARGAGRRARRAAGAVEPGARRRVRSAVSTVDTQASAARAREIIMEVERQLGFEPTDREFDKLGYDIESRIPGSGRLRFIEVKGRVSGAPTITVTRNEILCSLNKPEDYILGIVEFIDGGQHRVHYVREPFRREPDFGVTSVNYDFCGIVGESRGTEMRGEKIQPYSREQLEQMLIDTESELVERKESFSGKAPNTVREAVCAFANDLPNHQRPGVVFIGAKDNGWPAGLEISDDLLRQLSDIKTDGNIIPPPTLTVNKHHLHDAEVAVITVWPADSPPVTYKGRICIRIGPRRANASAQDERVLNEKRRYRDRPYDVQPVTAFQIQDLDLRRFEAEYLPAAVPPDVLEANDRTVEQRLAAAKMIAAADDPVPTVLGLLVIGKVTRNCLPGAYVQFLRIDGDMLSDPVIDEKLIDGTVRDVIQGLDDKLIAYNRTAVDFSSQPLEKRKSLYPSAALQQLTRNAVLHRSYEGANAPSKVYWFNDRIEILSPGGPYGEVTPSNFGTPGLTDYRNPNLAESMRVLGYVQKFGGGIVTSRTALTKNGNPPPEFEAESTHVRVTLRPAV